MIGPRGFPGLKGQKGDPGYMAAASLIMRTLVVDIIPDKYVRFHDR